MRRRYKSLTYGSVCSGIEAASVAWEPLGFAPLWFAQFDPEHNYATGPDFPSAVLAHHWPQVPNLGDMTTIATRIRAGSIAAPDILVGGTPCQAYSVAGLRGGLADPRGALTLAFVDLCNAIDEVRITAGDEPVTVVWENVPGVLSSKDNAFGCFLAGLVGETVALQPAGGKWTNAGYVLGPQRSVAWRVLDAQYFGVAQRRRRVFVVASADPDCDPAQILFESHGVRRDTPPSRETGQVVAALTARGVGTCGADDNQATAGHLRAFRMTAFGEYADDETASTVKARDYKDATDLAVAFNWQAAGNTSATLGMAEITGALQCSQLPAVCVTGDITHTLKARGFDGSEDGTGRGQPIVACEPYTLAIRGRGDSVNLEYRQDGTANALLTPNGGRCGIGVGAVAFCIQHASIGRADNAGPQGKGYQQNVAFTQDARCTTDVVTYGLHVRRLLPMECERLQGFPDGHTNITYRNKECADSHRYKACGNSMAVPVMHWIGLRIILHRVNQ